jgi:hypothetical protein
VRSSETLLDRKAILAAVRGLTRGIPLDKACEANHLKTGQSMFQRKGDKIVQGWMGKRLVQMKSTIHDGIVLNAGKQGRTDLEIKKSYMFYFIALNS